MRRTGAILTLVAVVSLAGASNVLAGSAGAPAGKTTGPAVVATIVMDLTGGGFPADPGKGLTSIRIQRSGSSAAALFTSLTIFGVPCNDVVGDTDGRFVGKLNGWVPGLVLTSLFGPAGDKAVITDTDYPTCTSVIGGAGGGTREVLSFTAVIQFEAK